MIAPHLYTFLSKHHCAAGEPFRQILTELSDALEAGSSCLPLEQSLLSKEGLREALACGQEGSVVGHSGASTPLILHEDKLYFSRYFSYEKEIADSLLKRLENSGSLSSDLESQLSALFTDKDQAEAARKALCNSFSIISGGPGTGKTTTVRNILLLLQQNGDYQDASEVLMLAPTGKAADRLRQSLKNGSDSGDVESLPTETHTIHRALGGRPGSVNFRHDQGNPLPARIVIIDESSMVPLPLMAKLIRALPQDAKLILLGDQFQLNSVEVGSVLADLISSHEDPTSPMHHAVTILRKSYRNQGSIHDACEAIKSGDPTAFFSLLSESENGKLTEDKLLHLSPLPYPIQPSLEPLIKEHWVPVLTTSDLSIEDRLQRIDDFRILTPTHHGPHGIEAVNQTVEAILRSAGVDTADPWYEGRSVIVQENDHHLGIYNGDTGLCVTTEKGERKVAFPSADSAEGIRLLSPTILPAVSTAWALTIHRTQGSEYNNILLILPELGEDTDASSLTTRELLYTGLSRTKAQASLWATPETLTRTIENQALRASGLQGLLHPLS